MSTPAAPEPATAPEALSRLPRIGGPDGHAHIPIQSSFVLVPKSSPSSLSAADSTQISVIELVGEDASTSTLQCYPPSLDTTPSRNSHSLTATIQDAEVASARIQEFFTDDNGRRLVDINNLGSNASTAEGSSTASLTGTVVPAGILDLELDELCKLIRGIPSLQTAQITSTETYVTSNRGVRHRFLLLEIRRSSRKTLWLRLDRRRDRKVSLARFALARGVTTTRDTARLTPYPERLCEGTERENRQEFSQPPTLSELDCLLQIVRKELTIYHLWPENCWFFCSLIQEHLGEESAPCYVMGGPQSENLAKPARNRIRRLVRLSKYKLIISIDVGSSQSAVAVFYSQPGIAPLVTHVSRWPGQESTIYEEKVPSALIYDKEGKLVYCGAEAASADAEREAKTKGYHRVENFKMHLHTATVLEKSKLVLQDLPPNVGISKIYTDYLSFLLCQTRRHLDDLTGSDPWPDLQAQAQIVFTHPNNWGVVQQRLIFHAAAAAGLLTDDDNGFARLSFFEEGEASATFCMATQTTIASQISVGSRFIVCDAGAMTADISAYRVTSKTSSAFSLEELDAPSCLDAGGARVDHCFKEHISSALAACRIDLPEEVSDLVSEGLRDFQKGEKRRFTSPETTVAIKLGPRSMNDPSLRIKRGVIAFEGAIAESFFAPSTNTIIDTIRDQCRQHKIKHVILTGGFGESPYLKCELEKRLGRRPKVIPANASNSKAVAIGGLRLMTEGIGRVTIDRTPRPRKTWIKTLASPFVAIFRTRDRSSTTS